MKKRTKSFVKRKEDISIQGLQKILKNVRVLVIEAEMLRIACMCVYAES